MAPATITTSFHLLSIIAKKDIEESILEILTEGSSTGNTMNTTEITIHRTLRKRGIESRVVITYKMRRGKQDVKTMLSGHIGEQEFKDIPIKEVSLEIQQRAEETFREVLLILENNQYAEIRSSRKVLRRQERSVKSTEWLQKNYRLV